MNNHFNNLPFDLQNTIIQKATKPIPKFKSGLVKQKRKTNTAFYRLLFIRSDTPPSWNPSKKEFVYTATYGYTGTGETSVYESDLEPIAKSVCRYESSVCSYDSTKQSKPITPWTIDTFMQKHFNDLPFDLQNMIIQMATKPVPKFQYGDAVEFCESHKQQIWANNHHNILHTEMPISRLLVVSYTPYWDTGKKEFEYNLQYGIGNDHETFAFESMLRPWPRNKFAYNGSNIQTFGSYWV